MSNKITGDGSGSGQLFAVEKFNVADEVLELYQDNIPLTQISDRLKAKGIDIKPLAINRWIAEQKKAAVTKSKDESLKKFEVIALNYKNEITSILEEVKELKKFAKDEKKLDLYVKLVSKLFQGIELLAKLMGDIKPSNSVDINIIINEMNKKVFDEKKSLRNNLFGKTVIDVEAEITESDKKEEEKIKGE